MSCNRCTVKCDVCGEHNDVRAAAYFHLLRGVCRCCVPAVVLTHVFMERSECDNINDPAMSEDTSVGAARLCGFAGLLYHRIPKLILDFF